MTLRELYNALNERIPQELSCDWDNDGVMLCMDWERPVNKVMTCLDVTDSCVRHACANGVDLIVSHHPMIFHPLKRLDCAEREGGLFASLIASKIAVFSFHTRLDAVSGGLNDRLAREIGVRDAKEVDAEEGRLVRMGSVGECSPAEFAQRVSTALQTPVRCFEGTRRIRTVMSVCGGGKDFLPLALQLGADAFVSGDLSYNAALEACESGLTVVDATHRGTELPVCRLLGDIIREICAQLVVEEYPYGGEQRLFFP